MIWSTHYCNKLCCYSREMIVKKPTVYLSFQSLWNARSLIPPVCWISLINTWACSNSIILAKKLFYNFHISTCMFLFIGVLKTTSSPEMQRRPHSYTSDDVSFSDNFNTSFGSMPSSLSDSIPPPKGNIWLFVCVFFALCYFCSFTQQNCFASS